MKDIGYFTHDHNARHDEKCKALIKKYGIEGYGRFWIIVEKLRESRGQKLELNQLVLDSLAEEMKCSNYEVKTFIKDCIDKFKLFIQEDNVFYSESLLERLAKLKYLRSIRQKGAYAMHEKFGHNITKDPNNDPDNDQ